MIRDMLEALDAALAQGMTRAEARQAAEVAVRQKYAGERVYIAALPKQRRAWQVARLNLRTSREIAAATGLPLRTVQRLRSGR